MRTDLNSESVPRCAGRQPKHATAEHAVCEAGAPGHGLQFSEFLTPTDVAKILKVNEKTVIRRFQKVPGVIDIGSEETRYKRRYRVLRIPPEALQRFIVESRVQ